MKILQLSINELIPYEFNNKIHSEEQINKIANSINECGFRAPILVDEKNVILAWHGRLLGAKKLWLKEVPVIQYTDLTEKQKKKYRILDNRIADLSDYNIENLKVELEEIWDPELYDLFSDLWLEMPQDELDLENQDIAPVPQDNEPLVRPGDIFRLWSHLLGCLDATLINSYTTLVQDTVDMIFTDPPYNINYKWSGKKTSNWIKNDHMEDEAFNNFLYDAFKCMNSIISDTSPWYVFHSHKTQKVFEQALNDNNIDVLYQLIWNKPSVNHIGWHYKQKHEPFFYCCEKWKRPKFYWDIYDTTIPDFDRTDEQILNDIKKFREAEKNGKTTIWSMKRHNVQDYDHPTQKPVDLVAYAIKNSSRIGDKVLDPFGWSGTTLITCEREHRVCYTMELDPKYIEVIIKRYNEFTKSNVPIQCLNREIDIRDILENV